jgi:hypothetical protein
MRKSELVRRPKKNSWTGVRLAFAEGCWGKLVAFCRALRDCAEHVALTSFRQFQIGTESRHFRVRLNANLNFAFRDFCRSLSSSKNAVLLAVQTVKRSLLQLPRANEAFRCIGSAW